MVDRKFDLLKTIIEAYIDRAQPIGSKAVVMEYHFPVSPATIRNEMNDLEQEGYLEQPHTSAGRIPTEKAYQWYVEHALEIPKFDEEQQSMEDVMFAMRSSEAFEQLKALARWLADYSHEAVLMSTPSHEVYSTGLGNLFSKPECADRDVVIQLSRVFDRLDEMVETLHRRPLESNLTVLIGDDCPIGEDFSIVATRMPTDPPSLIGLVGPMRMSYARNIGIMRLLSEQEF